MHSFLIRSARARDAADLRRLARSAGPCFFGGSGDLPRLLRDSERSFAGSLSALEEGVYLFVLEDEASGRAVGASVLFAKRGRPGRPFAYFSSFVESRTSLTLNRTVKHRCLRLGATEDGPTMLGAVFVPPALRGRKEKPEEALCAVRLLFMAAHLDRFQTHVLTSFPSRTSGGCASPFWEALGRPFTGLDRGRAEKLSGANKEFLLSLIPQGTIYQEFLPEKIVAGLGRPADSIRALERLLAGMGFRYLHQLEPFDGGPCYGTLTREVGLIRAARQLQCQSAGARPSGKSSLVLSEDGSGVRALVAPVRFQGVQASLDGEAARRLGINAGDWFWAAPLP
jgi:arginine N-succinyltransferase